MSACATCLQVNTHSSDIPETGDAKGVVLGPACFELQHNTNTWDIRVVALTCI